MGYGERFRLCGDRALRTGDDLPGESRQISRGVPVGTLPEGITAAQGLEQRSDVLPLASTSRSSRARTFPTRRDAEDSGASEGARTRTADSEQTPSFRNAARIDDRLPSRRLHIEACR